MSEGEGACLGRGSPAGQQGQSWTTDNTRKERREKQTERFARKVQNRIIEGSGFLLAGEGGLSVEDWCSA